MSIADIKRVVRKGKKENWWDTPVDAGVGAPCADDGRSIVMIGGKGWSDIRRATAAEAAAALSTAEDLVLAINLARLRAQWVTEMRPLLAKLFAEALGLKGRAARVKAKELLEMMEHRDRE